MQSLAEGEANLHSSTLDKWWGMCIFNENVWSLARWLPQLVPSTTVQRENDGHIGLAVCGVSTVVHRGAYQPTY